MTESTPIRRCLDLSDQELAAITLDRYHKNPWEFIRDCCFTIDEADDGKIKAFPDYDYLRIVCEKFQEHKILAIPKSRRLMMTWIMLALHLHLALFTPNSAIFIQSKKFIDSCYLLSSSRLMFIYYHLPEWLRDFGLPTLTSENQGQLKFSNGSMIRAIGQGPDQLRQYTATALLIDEMAFMEMAEMTWRAARPVLQGGGRVSMVSSAQAGFFERVVHGKLADRDAEQDGF
jgi:hypothetical protein